MAGRLRTAAALALLLLSAALAAAQQATPGQPGLFQTARPLPEGETDEPEAFEFEQDGYRYRVVHNGAGRRTKDDAVRLFNLRLETGDRLTRVYFSEYVNNPLLACEVNDAETGAGFVVRLEQPSLRARWKAHIPGFNLGPPLRDGQHLYLTAVGFVAKLDLKTGRFVWRHSRFYGRAGEGSFNSFGPPALDGDAVLFKEAPPGGGPARTIRVNRKTGKILGIE